MTAADLTGGPSEVTVDVVDLASHLEGVERALLVGVRDELLRLHREYQDSAERIDGSSVEAWLDDHDLDTVLELAHGLDSVQAVYVTVGLPTLHGDRQGRLALLRDQQQAAAKRWLDEQERRRAKGEEGRSTGHGDTAAGEQP